MYPFLFYVFFLALKITLRFFNVGIAVIIRYNKTDIEQAVVAFARTPSPV